MKGDVLNDFAHTLTRWVVRIGLLVVGGVFFLCLLMVVALLAVLWGARALWAKITGQPVTPWVMPAMRQGAAWNMYRAGQWGGAAAEATDESAPFATSGKRGGVLADTAKDITDVQPREVRE